MDGPICFRGYGCQMSVACKNANFRSGNGGYAGYIDQASIVTYANLGHAVVGGDGGHNIASNSGSQYVPFLWDPQQTVAWLRDAIAILTGPTRDLTTLFYGTRPMYSYYAGCSTGGAQGFAVAQYHPELYDGVLAGSPGNWYSHLILSFLWNFRHSQNASFLPQSALDLVTNRTLDACDTLDGVQDRLIENPLDCHFNVSTLACGPSQQPLLNNTTQCLTSAQLIALQAFYSGPVSNTTQAYPGFSPGSESGLLYQEVFLTPTYADPILANTVFKNIGYNAATFNFDSDVTKVDSTASPLIDSISADLLAFKFHGGKMVVTQGWADPFNAAIWPINHLNAIDKHTQATKHGKAADFVRLFMVPGYGHCGTVPSYPYVPGTLNAFATLTYWVENGTAPVELIATSPPDGSNRSRKLCSWPLTAKLLPGGDPTSYRGYACA